MDISDRANVCVCLWVWQTAQGQMCWRVSYQHPDSRACRVFGCWQGSFLKLHTSMSIIPAHTLKQIHTSLSCFTPRTHKCSTCTHLLEEQGVIHVLCIDRGESVLVLSGDVHLIARQDVANRAELLDFPLEHLLQPLVLQLRALHLLTQICKIHTTLGWARYGKQVNTSFTTYI